MMTAEQLKASILQLAMQGKLVEQRAEEGTGEELYELIQQEKSRLVQKKIISKSNSFESISEDEIPFDIPESWEWVRICEVSTVVTGGTPSKFHTEYYGDIFPFYKPADIQDSKYLLDANTFLSEEGKNASRVIPRGSIAVNCIGNIGKSAILPKDGTTNQQINSICYFPNPDFMYWVCQSSVFVIQLKNMASMTTIPIVNKSKMERCIIPLPPLEEQKRIVAKIEELMPFVEQYAKASTRLNTLSASFPDQMKKSILQQAVMGKLVPQDPNDEPASVLLKKITEEKQKLIKEKKIKKQKPLAEIAEDEIPFDIPETWEWVRVGSFFTTSSGTTPSRANSSYYNHKDFNWVRTTDLNNGILKECEIQVSLKAFTECRLEVIPQDSVCLAMYGGSGTIGKNALIRFDTTINQSVCAIHPNGCNMKYVQLYMQYIRPRWMDFASGSRKDPNINQIIIKNCLIAIPPLKEQDRIVEQVYSVIDRIEKLNMEKR